MAASEDFGSDGRVERADAGLPTIPVVDLQDAADPTLVLLEQHKDRTERILASARRAFTKPVLAFGERHSRQWVHSNASPYGEEVAAVAAALGETGGYFLNVNYEWACTSSVLPGGAGEPGAPPRLLRALDWLIEGLGTEIVVARRKSPAGPWLDFTWPGFVGTIHGLAAGRFAAAINQAPLARRSGLFGLDWLLARRTVARSRALPATHLLRQAFETAKNFSEARALLRETEIAAPAIFLLAGTRPGEGVIIERKESEARELPMPSATANHWQGFGDKGWSRGIDSRGRLQTLSEWIGRPNEGQDWTAEPISNALTRLVFSAEPASGDLWLQGLEGGQPATAPLHLREAPYEKAEIAALGR